MGIFDRWMMIVWGGLYSFFLELTSEDRSRDNEGYGLPLWFIQLDNFGALLFHILPFDILVQLFIMSSRFIMHPLCSLCHLHDFGYLLFPLSLDNDIKYGLVLWYYISAQKSVDDGFLRTLSIFTQCRA